MPLTKAAQWIEQTFYQLDYSVLSSLHQLAENHGTLFTPFFRFISMFAEFGIVPICLALLLLSRKKTRRMGLCVAEAILLGTVITNLTLKEIIARPRPFMDTAAVYHSWWQTVGSPFSMEFSFPSGHVTVTMCTVTALVLAGWQYQGWRKYGWLGFVFVVLMGLSRNYLMVHYPSDVLGGFLAGGLAGVLGFAVSSCFYALLDRFPECWFTRLVYQLDVADLLRGKQKRLDA